MTHLNNQYPWGIWIGIDVAAGVALAAGGFTTAALGHVMHREQYHAVVRPALLTAMLGYTMVAVGVSIDIGRYYYIWHPLIMWNGNSALFEVGICVMIYMTVLYIEFLPVVTERFIGRVNLPGMLRAAQQARSTGCCAGSTAGCPRRCSSSSSPGVVLSTLHQSSLGTLMVIAGPKMHPLWQTPDPAAALPAVGRLRRLPDGHLRVAARLAVVRPQARDGASSSKLGRMMAPLLGVYLAFKLGDMFVRETFVYLTTVNTAERDVHDRGRCSAIVIPLRMFLSRDVLKSPPLLFTAAALVVGGVLLNRINNFVVAYTPPYSFGSYFPSIGEISVTVGFISILVLLYRAAVIIFPVISLPDRTLSPKAKYSVRG